MRSAVSGASERGPHIPAGYRLGGDELDIPLDVIYWHRVNLTILMCLRKVSPLLPDELRRRILLSAANERGDPKLQRGWSESSAAWPVTSLQRLTKFLEAAGRSCLEALASADQRTAAAVNLLDVAPSRRDFGRIFSSLLGAFSYAADQTSVGMSTTPAWEQPGAPAHTDRGLLTLVYSCQPGPQAREI